MLRHLDYPPVWLLGALALVWGETVVAPEMLPWSALTLFGTSLVILAIALFAAAGVAFLRARTTIIPHQMPEKMITEGIFAFSRNPIYLADVVLLVGLSLRWGAISGLLLAPALVWVLQRRFILPEEERLQEAFGDDAVAYFERTRRWL